MAKRKEKPQNLSTNTANITVENIPTTDSASTKLLDKKIFWALVIAFLGMILYANTWNHEYVYDDGTVTSKNWVVKGGLKNFDLVWTKPYRYGFGSPNSTYKLYRPMPVMMFMIEWAIAPDYPALSHMVNIAMYGLLGFSLFYFLSFLFDKKSLLFSIIGCILFMAHPLHTEVVANIKERESILALLFGLLSFYGVIKYMRTEKLQYLIVISVGLFLGILSKDIAVTFLGVGVLLVFLLSKSKFPIKEIIYVSIAYIVPITIFLILRKNIVGESGLTGAGDTSGLDNILYDTDSKYEKFLTAITLLFNYFKLHVLPHPLVADYSKAAVEIVKSPNFKTFLSLIIHFGGLGYGVYRFFTKKDVLSFFILFYFVTISVVSNVIIPIGTSFGERLMFVPSLGFCMVIAWGLMKFFKIDIDNSSINVTDLLRSKMSLCLVVGLIVLLYSFKTVTRNPEWKSGRTLFSADVKKNPNSARLNAYYAQQIMDEEFYRDTTQEAQKSINIDAEAKLLKALRIYPQFGLALERYGMILFRKGMMDSALVYYDKAIKVDTGMAQAYVNKAAILFQRGKVDESYALIDKSLKLDSTSRDGLFNMGNIMGEKGNFEESIKYLKKAIEQDEKHAPSHTYVGISYFNNGDFSNALTYLNKAIKLSSKESKAYQFKALAQMSLYNYKDAISTIDQGLSINTIEAESLKSNMLIQKAKILFEMKKFSEAEAILGPIINANNQNFAAIAALGQVYCMQGKYDKAFQFLNTAIPNKPRELSDFYFIARSMIGLGDKAKGINTMNTMVETLEAIVQKSPDDQRAMYFLADIYKWQGKTNESNKLFSKVTQYLK